MKHVLILHELNKKDTCQEGVVLILRNDYFPFLHKREQVKHIKKGTGYEGLVPFKRRDAQMKSGRNGRRLPNHLSLGVEDVVGAEDVDLTIHKNFDRFVGVYMDILDTIGPIGMERRILSVYLLTICVFGDDC